MLAPEYGFTASNLGALGGGLSGRAAQGASTCADSRFWPPRGRACLNRFRQGPVKTLPSDGLSDASAGMGWRESKQRGPCINPASCHDDGPANQGGMEGKAPPAKAAPDGPR